MISDKLYQLAFEYKKTKLWKTLWDTDIFALRSSDGQINYISVMGAIGDHCALGAHIGSDGLNSFMKIVKTDPLTASSLELQEHFIQQDCLQCIFKNKDGLSDEEREEAKKYARSHGIKIAGKKAYPQFKRYTPNHLPWHLQTEKEQEILCEALAAAIALSQLLKKSSPNALGFERSYDNPKEIPLMEYKDNKYVLGKTELPPERPIKIPAPKASNDIGVASLKKLKKTGIWECEIIRFPQPVQNDPEEIPFFPITLLAVESSTGYILQVPPVGNYEEDPEHLLNLFIESLINEQICPIKIKVRDERTYTFAKPLCDRLKITVSMEEEMPTLDEAEEDLIAHLEMDEEEQMENLSGMLDTLLDLDRAQLDALPDEMMGLFKMLTEKGVLPDELQEKVNTIFFPDETVKPRPKRPRSDQKPSGSQRSYVISVSLGTGCYRHIQIAGRCPLLELHSAILDAFGFIDDHAHAFFMDNISWSEEDSYYVSGIESHYRTTKKYTLDHAGLHKGMEFKYIFDFGDEWTFQCKVLRVVEGDTAQPVILKSKGEAPDQYSYWDDE